MEPAFKLLEISEKLHSLPQQQLEDLTNFPIDGFRGYTGSKTYDATGLSVAEKYRHYQSFELGRSSKPFDPPTLRKDLKGVLNCPNVWPTGIVNTVKEAEQCYDAFTSVALDILSDVLSTDRDSLESYFSVPTGNLRLLKYVDSDVSNIPMHTDYEFITLIHASRPSLVVENSNSISALGESLDNLIVLAGDSLDFLTNSEIRRIRHGAKPSGLRYSNVFFLCSNADVQINNQREFIITCDSRQYFSPASHTLGMNLANNHALRERFRGTSVEKTVPSNLSNPFDTNED